MDGESPDLDQRLIQNQPLAESPVHRNSIQKCDFPDDHEHLLRQNKPHKDIKVEKEKIDAHLAKKQKEQN